MFFLCKTTLLCNFVQALKQFKKYGDIQKGVIIYDHSKQSNHIPPFYLKILLI